MPAPRQCAAVLSWGAAVPPAPLPSPKAGKMTPPGRSWPGWSAGGRASRRLYGWSALGREGRLRLLETIAAEVLREGDQVGGEAVAPAVFNEQ